MDHAGNRVKRGLWMAKHRRMSERSRRTRTVVGGLAAGGALAAVRACWDGRCGDNPEKDMRSRRTRRVLRSVGTICTTPRQVCASPNTSATRSSTTSNPINTALERLADRPGISHACSDALETCQIRHRRRQSDVLRQYKWQRNGRLVQGCAEHASSRSVGQCPSGARMQLEERPAAVERRYSAIPARC